MKVKNGPGKGSKDVKNVNPDMLGTKGLNGAYGSGKLTTDSNYGKGGYERKGFYW